jgi:hypothetical protein
MGHGCQIHLLNLSVQVGSTSTLPPRHQHSGPKPLRHRRASSKRTSRGRPPSWAKRMNKGQETIVFPRCLPSKTVFVTKVFHWFFHILATKNYGKPCFPINISGPLIFFPLYVLFTIPKWKERLDFQVAWDMFEEDLQKLNETNLVLPSGNL